MTARTLSSRVLCSLALLLVLAASAVTLMPATAEASHNTRCGNYFYYYSDATYTTLVGVRFYECDCTLNSWGTISFYRVIESLGCGGH